MAQNMTATPSADLTDTIILYLIDHGMQILVAIGIMAAGAYIAKISGTACDRWLQKRKLEPQVRQLVVRIARLFILGFFLIMALGQMGIQITPLLAGLGVAGVGVSLAMQGLLGNVVAGLTIIFSKPFTVGEYIEVQNVYGQVTDISLFSTTLLHADMSKVIVPNRKIVGEILHNYGTMRQLDLSVGVAYDTDLGAAVALIQEMLGRNPHVLKEPTPVVGAVTLGDSSILIAVKPWVGVGDVAAATAAINEALARELPAKGIALPFPQYEVRVRNG